MKILHILYSGLGGHGNVFFSLVKADIHGKFRYQALFNGIEPVRGEYIQRCEALGIPWTFVSKTPGFDFDYYKQLYRQVRRSKADLIFIHSSSYILPAFLGTYLTNKKARVIVRETQANHLKSKQEWFWLGVALLLADKIVCLSDIYNQQVKQKFGFLYNAAKVTVIPNGIDLEKFQPIPKVFAQEILIGMQSRLVTIKDHPTLIAAFDLLQKRHPQQRFRLVIAGDGDTMFTLTNFANTLSVKNQILFLGLLSEAELINFMTKLDIYVHASFGETMSTAIMQAMACGIPIVASDVNGISNMLEHEKTGLLVPVENVLAMANALERCFSDKAFALNIANNASRFAKKHFANDVMFNKYLPIFYEA